MDIEMEHQFHKELGVVGSWWQGMMKNASANKLAQPNYFASTPEILQSEAHLGSFMVGNSDNIYSHICPSIESAQDEVILVTCFWAQSSSLDMVSQSLRTLSDRVIKQNQTKVRVYIGFSSLSALQKLSHTRSLRGKTYSKAQWKSKLWLPDAAELPGLDLQVKSLFVLPFSVMHPKFVIIDRQMVFLPSCNVSWESWFEGCITLSGPVVNQFIVFWRAFWLQEATDSGVSHTLVTSGRGSAAISSVIDSSTRGAAHAITSLHQLPPAPAIFLPSPHHANPAFTFPWQKHKAAPATPLNVFISELIQSASSSIYMQTPNITAPPVLSLILQALRRGVHVHILTSERLMILEQLVTAGTTTARCVKKLVKLYKRAASSARVSDEESRPVSVGSLRVDYYEPRAEETRQWGEPVQSHLKLTIVDGEWTVLGSGNMDRASWYTSQELGVAFRSEELAKIIMKTVSDQMQERTKLAFDSNAI